MKIILFILLVMNLHASIKQDMLGLYQNKKFEDACKLGFRNFQTYTKDEEYVSLYAFSCLKSDYIDRLAVPIVILRRSSESRSNAAYFSIILMQKKLLYHSLIDNYNLAPFNLPTTDYILSKVFNLYSKLGVHEPRRFYLFQDSKNKKVTYKLYLSKDDKLNKLVIEEFYDTSMIKRHIYW